MITKSKPSKMSDIPNISDDDFAYISENDEDIWTNNSAHEEGRWKMNKDGKKVRRKDVVWRDMNTFDDPNEYKSSDVFSEIDEDK